MADGSVVIGVSLDTAAFAASVSTLETQVSQLGTKINSSVKDAFTSSGIDTSMSTVIAGVLRQVSILTDAMTLHMKNAATRGITSFLTANWHQLGEESMGRLALGISSGEGIVSGTLRGVAGSASSAFSGSWSLVGRDIMLGIAEGIRSAGSHVINAVREVSAETDGAIREYYQISSPSALMRDEVGVMISRGIAEGITAGSSFIKGALGDIYSQTAERGRTYESSSSKNVTQNIYLRDDDSSPYLTAKRIKREGKAIFR